MLFEADHAERFAGLHQQRADAGEEDDTLAVEAAHHRVGGKEAVDLGGGEGDVVVGHTCRWYSVFLSVRFSDVELRAFGYRDVGGNGLRKSRADDRAPRLPPAA